MSIYDGTGDTPPVVVPLDAAIVASLPTEVESVTVSRLNVFGYFNRKQHHHGVFTFENAEFTQTS
eukprot:COSAG06_NODE_2492_length_6769_cov_2.361619_7_plen_65_part_00